MVVMICSQLEQCIRNAKTKAETEMCMAEKYCQDVLNNSHTEGYCKERASSEGKA